MPQLTNEEIIEIFTYRLPAILEERPELEPYLYHIFLKTFARKEEVAIVRRELSEFRSETKSNFEKVDEEFKGVRSDMAEEFKTVRSEMQAGFDHVDEEFKNVRSEMQAGFDRVDEEFKGVRSEIKDVVRHIDRLGARWGIRNEALFRATIADLLAESFGVTVETRDIEGEQFDVIISNGQHILIEITASAGRTVQQRLERKRELYTRTTGVRPARVILATASIHSRRAEALRAAGFEVIEPEEDEEW